MSTFKMLPWQAIVFNNPSRFRIVAGGRRTGKTVLCVQEAYRAAQSPHGSVVYVTPNRRMATDVVWRELLKTIPVTEIKRIDHVNLTIELKFFDSTIHVFSASDVKNRIIGKEFSFIIFEEPSFIPKNIWTEYLRPCLSPNHGEVFLAGTPRADGSEADEWFRDLYLKGQDPTEKNFFSYRIDTEDANTVSPKEFEEIRQSLSYEQFSRELVGSFGGVAA